MFGCFQAETLVLGEILNLFSNLVSKILQSFLSKANFYLFIYLISSNKISENLALRAGLTLLAFMFFVIFLQTSKESISLMLSIF